MWFTVLCLRAIEQAGSEFVEENKFNASTPCLDRTHVAQSCVMPRARHQQTLHRENPKTAKTLDLN